MTDRTFIIAEAGVNHNGSLSIAFDLLDAAVQAGADAVKYQTFKTEALVERSAPRAEYQARASDIEETQFEMLKKLELSEADHRALIERAKQKGIEFLSTPFEAASLRLLTDTFGIRKIKIPSGEITNAPFLLEIARRAEKIILSTGMSTIDDVREALGVLAFGFLNAHERPSLQSCREAFLSAAGQSALQGRVTLLHATTEYPAPFPEVNLRAMDSLKSVFGLPVGYSDHTRGIHAAVAAVARGACVIEKHFTMDRNLPGPDHKASLEPAELKLMVESIRDVEQALGDGNKVPTASEIKNMPIARKSIVASVNIAQGDTLTESNVTCKRPGSGVSPMHYWERIGKKAQRSYNAGELLDD